MHLLAKDFTVFIENLAPFSCDDIKVDPSKIEDVWIDPDFLKELKRED